MSVREPIETTIQTTTRQGEEITRILTESPTEPPTEPSTEPPPEPDNDLEDSYTSERRRSTLSWDYERHSRAPVKLSWKQQVSVSLHWRCLTLSLLLLVCFCLLTWCRVPVHYLIPCRNGLVWIPSTITIIFYTLYIVECFHCKLHRELVNVIHADSAHILLNRWIRAKPVIRWRAISYHYGRTYRQRYNGSQTVPQSQYMRINSETRESRYQPNDCSCVDKSTPLTSFKQYAIVKVEIDKSFSFGCACAEAAYLTQRKAFYERQVAVDDFIELNEMFHLAGSQVPDSLCIINTKTGKLPWYCWRSVFWVMSVFCLSWPLRLLMEQRTAYASIVIHKEFGGRCNGVLATSGQYSISSYDSKYSENIYGLIPSYSEALFMSSYTLNGTRIPSTGPPPTRRVISRPGTYETITYSNDEHVTSAAAASAASASRKPRHKRSPAVKLFSSKTSENLIHTHSIASGYQCSKPVPRSVSLHVPNSDKSVSQRPAGEIITNINTSQHPISKQPAALRTHHSSYSMVNAIKHIVSPSPRSKTVGETMNLL